MSGDNRQICELAKRGLTADEIAASLGYDVEAVEFVLKNDPSVARELEVANDKSLVAGGVEAKIDKDFNRILPRAQAVIEDLLDNAENESVKANLAKFIVSQQLGLMKPKVSVNVFNIGDFNARLKQVNEQHARVMLENKIIDVPSVISR